MSEIFPGVAATPAPAPTTTTTTTVADPTLTTVDPTTALLSATPAEPSLSDLFTLVQSLSSELATLKQNPAVQGLIQDVGPFVDRMGTNPFVDKVKEVVGSFEDDFRALVRDEVSKHTSAPVVAAAPAPVPPATTTYTTAGVPGTGTNAPIS